VLGTSVGWYGECRGVWEELVLLMAAVFEGGTGSDVGLNQIRPRGSSHPGGGVGCFESPTNNSQGHFIQRHVW
jgi:hypothetical protein